MDLNKLKAPFKSEQVRWRVGKLTKDKKKGMALAYVDARDVQDRLDEVCGVDGWSTSYEYHGKTCLCYLTIDGVTKADGSGDTAVEAEKGAISKAFVRVASAWGIGRYFYNAKNIWVELDEYKKIKKSEQSKLDKVHDKIAKGIVTGETPEEKPETPEDILDRMIVSLNKQKTVEAVDKFVSHAKVKEALKAQDKKFNDDFDRCVEQRKNEITSDVS